MYTSKNLLNDWSTYEPIDYSQEFLFIDQEIQLNNCFTEKPMDYFSETVLENQEIQLNDCFTEKPIDYNSETVLENQGIHLNTKSNFTNTMVFVIIFLLIFLFYCYSKNIFEQVFRNRYLINQIFSYIPKKQCYSDIVHLTTISQKYKNWVNILKDKAKTGSLLIFQFDNQDLVPILETIKSDEDCTFYRNLFTNYKKSFSLEKTLPHIIETSNFVAFKEYISLNYKLNVKSIVSLIRNYKLNIIKTNGVKKMFSYLESYVNYPTIMGDSFNFIKYLSRFNINVKFCI